MYLRPSPIKGEGAKLGQNLQPCPLSVNREGNPLQRNRNPNIEMVNKFKNDKCK